MIELQETADDAYFGNRRFDDPDGYTDSQVVMNLMSYFAKYIHGELEAQLVLFHAATWLDEIIEKRVKRILRSTLYNKLRRDGVPGPDFFPSGIYAKAIWHCGQYWNSIREDDPRVQFCLAIYLLDCTEEEKT